MAGGGVAGQGGRLELVNILLRNLNKKKSGGGVGDGGWRK